MNDGLLATVFALFAVVGVAVVMGIVLYFILSTPINISVMLFIVWTVFVTGIGVSIGSSR